VWQKFDPDFGVAIPHSLEAIENDPTLAELAYGSADKLVDAASLPLVVGYYATAADNAIDQSGREGMYYGMDGSAEIYRSREQFMELLKWVGPSVMMAAGLALGLAAFFWRGRRRKAEGSVETGASVPGATEVGRA
jgi:hypothetical protein